MFKPIFLDLLNESKMRIFLSIGVSLLIFADLAFCTGSLVWYSHNGWYYASPKNGNNSSRLTWYKARSYCLQHGGDLASIHSEKENEIIFNLISTPANDGCWIGAADLGVSQFGWTDGSAFDFVKWAQNEPNDGFGSQKCVQILSHTGYWNDNDCNEEYGFVCKRPQGSVHPQTPTPTGLIAGGCPPGYEGVHKGNKCFRLVGGRHQSDWKNYTAARDECRKLGGDIASISNRIEQAFLISMTYDQLPIWSSDVIGMWIGLNDCNSNRKYTWQDSYELVITNWAKGQPSEHGGNCVEMYTDPRRAGKWHNIQCSNKRGYICETTRNSALPTTAPTHGACETGYLGNSMNDCFKVYPTAMNWTQAKSSCESVGSSLVSILNVYEQAFLDIITVDFSTPVWIGLADQGLTGTYSWVDNWEVYYTSWDKNEPSYTKGEGCIATHNGYWNDTMCANNYPFVCKKPLFRMPPPTAIPNGYCKDITWKHLGGSCYYINLRNKTSWSSAETSCKTMGMELVSILSRSEETFILQETDGDLAPSVNVWIGLRRTNGFFAWSDGSSISYMNFDKGQPSDINGEFGEDCMEMKHENGRWNDRLCNNSLGYVCKTDKLPATAQSTTATTTNSHTPSLPAIQTSLRGTLPTVSVPAAQTSSVMSRSSGVTTESSSQVTIPGSSQSNKQGLLCYSCNDMSHLEYCDVIQKCKDEEVCYVERYKDGAGIVFQSGCRNANVCLQRKQVSTNDVCVECCHGNFCNSKGCGDKGFPSLDQRGPICFDCHHIGSIEECRRISLCDSNQVCIVEEYKWGDHSHFKLGCAHQLCIPISRSIHHVVARSTPICHSCCQTDHCNRNCTVSNGGLPSEIIG